MALTSVANRPRSKSRATYEVLGHYSLPVRAVGYDTLMSEDEEGHRILKAAAERYAGLNWRETFEEIE
jgi:hypothetical protein